MSSSWNNYEIRDENRWYVLYTKPRSEKKVADQLKNMGLKAYCPVRTEMREWSDRRKKVEVPVLPSMILVNLAKRERNYVFMCPNAKRFLFWDGRPAMVPDHEVDALHESLTQQKVLNHESYSLEPGHFVDLSEWGLKGETGKVKYVSGNYCWIIMKNMGMVVKLKIGK